MQPDRAVKLGGRVYSIHTPDSLSLRLNGIAPLVLVSLFNSAIIA